MRLSLRFKIVGSFTLIVLVALALAVGTATRVTRVRYDEFAGRRDAARAQALAPLLGEWTAAASAGESTGLPPAFLILSSPPSRDVQPERRDGIPSMMERMMGSSGMRRDADAGMMMPDEPGMDRILLTDAGGAVLLDTAGYGRSRLDPARTAGVGIVHGGAVVGYLYLGRMIPDVRPPADFSYFRRAGFAAWLVTSAIFLFAAGLGILLSRHIVNPVLSLNRALDKVAAGEYSSRVPASRQDELGDLSRGFNAMATALESADTERRRMIADSAHELRTPVSLIRTRIEMMEEGVYPMDRDGLKALSEEADRLTRLVQELQTLSNLDSPDFALRKDDLDCLDVMRDVVAAAEPEIRRRGIEVRIEGPESGLRLKADTDQLHRLLRNLLSNAVRHAHGHVLLILRRPEPDAGTILFTVEDDGPGIPEHLREQVFRRYYRTDASRSRESGGSGLGLAICEAIVRARGGRIRAAESLRLGGARLEVTLPV